MNILRKIAVVTLLMTLSMTLSSGVATAANGCPTCGGWFYLVQSYDPSGYGSYQHDDRGPFGSESACIQARNLDFGDGDSWVPNGGLGCHWRFESDYDAYDEIKDHWNNLSNGGDINIGILTNAAFIKNVLKLREEFKLDSYEHKLNSLITDPEIDKPITDPDLSG